GRHTRVLVDMREDPTAIGVDASRDEPELGHGGVHVLDPDSRADDIRGRVVADHHHRQRQVAPGHPYGMGHDGEAGRPGSTTLDGNLHLLRRIEPRVVGLAKELYEHRELEDRGGDDGLVAAVTELLPGVDVPGMEEAVDAGALEE